MYRLSPSMYCVFSVYICYAKQYVLVVPSIHCLSLSMSWLFPNMYRLSQVCIGCPVVCIGYAKYVLVVYQYVLMRPPGYSDGFPICSILVAPTVCSRGSLVCIGGGIIGLQYVLMVCIGKLFYDFIFNGIILIFKAKECKFVCRANEAKQTRELS